jgi:hypothetical protein
VRRREYDAYTGAVERVAGRSGGTGPGNIPIPAARLQNFDSCPVKLDALRLLEIILSQRRHSLHITSTRTWLPAFASARSRVTSGA